MPRTPIAGTLVHLAGGSSATVMLLAMGQGPLGRIPVTQPTRLVPWLTASGPIIGLFGLLRVGLLAVSVYWTGIAVLMIGVRSFAGGSTLVASLSRRLPGFRLLTRGLASTSIAGVALLGGSTPSIADSNAALGTENTATTLGVSGSGQSGATSAASPPADRLTPPRLVPLSTPAIPKRRPARSATGSAQAAPGGGRSPGRVSPAGTSPGEQTPAGTAPGEVTPAGMSPASAITGPAQVWKVRPGDNLWSIAESVVGERLGRLPSESEIARYWLRVIETNRSRLPDPTNPSLLFAGDMISLPTSVQ